MIETQTALAMLRSGLSVLPAILSDKRPALREWSQYQSELPDPDLVSTWFGHGNRDAICIVCGHVSGNLELLDFDGGGELYPAWSQSIDPALLSRLVIETSQSGGVHVVYRCADPVPGNTRLATRSGVTLIETRGEGGLFLCSPSPGYTLTQGEMTGLPVITAAERDAMIATARALSDTDTTPKPKPVTANYSAIPNSSTRPGDDYNRRGDVRGLLESHGWQRLTGGDNEQWRRPGKSKGRGSATFNGTDFYVFSSNAPPFEPNEAYSPFAVYAMLEHGGDYAAATIALSGDGYGSNADPYPGVDLSAIIARCVARGTTPTPDREPMPTPTPDASLFRVPGFISDYMDWILSQSHHPNPPLAFAGALAMQAFLAGRRVMDASGTRPNLYVLALANSGVGKEAPREANIGLLTELGMMDHHGDQISSGQGIEDALAMVPSMLLQTDEIDMIIGGASNGRDPSRESIVSALLRFYSASGSSYSTRRKAGKEPAPVIDQPSLVMFGTSRPGDYYESLNARMLGNGFLARMLVIEGDPRSDYQQVDATQPIPASIMSRAREWLDMKSGNLSSVHPKPRAVYHDESGEHAMSELVALETERYRECESNSDEMGMATWARVVERAKKLALIYAVSEGGPGATITAAAVNWGGAMAVQQAEQMIFRAGRHVAESEFDSQAKRFIRMLDKGGVGHSTAMRRMRLPSREFTALVATLVERGDVVTDSEATGGRPKVVYKLA